MAKELKNNQKKPKTTTSRRGGVRPGSGRKKGVSKATQLKRSIQDHMTDAEFKDLLKHAITKAKDSNQILIWLLEQNTGKAPQRVEVAGDKESPLTITVISYNDAND